MSAALCPLRLRSVRELELELELELEMGATRPQLPSATVILTSNDKARPVTASVTILNFFSNTAIACIL